MDAAGKPPIIARYKPYYAELKSGKRYFWCACGLSKNQPYCDGSHQGTSFAPVPYRAGEDEEVLFCGCKHSGAAPFCDGTHNNLRDKYDTVDPSGPEYREIPVKAAGSDGRTELDGGCFITDVGRLARKTEGSLQYAPIISEDTGARFQSQFYFEVRAASSPVITFGDRHSIIFVLEGTGDVVISGREFKLAPKVGAYVRPGEAFLLSPDGDAPLKAYVSVCPLSDGPGFLSAMPGNFDIAEESRVMGMDPDERIGMADRFFQILVGKKQGCSVATQFIGEIPVSKAAPHRHLYEESLIIVSGQGYMWTETGKARVGAGDVIFLPRKQEHSLECVVEEGMMVAGVIYPGDNPSINY